jgi:2-dehydro-3-deoxyglucarate aldolase|tara:strand:- start:21 stop:653 length:633 start_codon:yes stop_codon:yes gene_type:complete
MEHSVIDLFDAENLIRTANLSGSIPLVRLPSNDEVVIKRILDAGSAGIIVPQINSEDELVRAIKATKYAPYGTRGAGLARAQSYGEDFDGYKSIVDNDLLIIAQIEDRKALKNLDSILSVPQLDAIIIGPYDLSASMGKAGQLDDKEVAEAIDEIVQKSIDKGVSCGIHIIEPNTDELNSRIKEGFNFIAYSLDIRMLSHNAKEALEQVK